MIDQRGQNVSFLEANKSFFKGYIDFLGYTTRKGYWFAILPYAILGILLGVLVFGQLVSIGFLSMLEGEDVDMFQILSSGVVANVINISFVSIIVFSLLAVPGITLYVRRLRDAGLTNQFIAIMFVISTISPTVLETFGGLLSLVSLVVNIIFLASGSDALKTASNHPVMQFLFEKK